MHCPNNPLNKKKSLPISLITLTLVLSLVFGYGAKYALAQTSNSEVVESNSATTLTAIPVRYGDNGSLKVKPGETAQVTVRVRNSSNKPLNILSFAQDFIVDSDGSTPIPVVDSNISNRWSLASWMTVAPNGQTLQPNEIGVVAVAIQVPEDALPGGHYAMILHQPTNDLSQSLTGNVLDGSDTTTGVSQQVGTLVYMVVDGPINEEVYIRNFIIPGFSEYGPVPFSYKIENRSDVHVSPSMMVDIKNWFGREVASIPVSGANVFPLTERAFDGQWNQVWGYGRYTATLTASYGESGKLAIATVQFWLLPVTLIIGVLIALLVLITTIIVIRKHLKHRKQSQSSRIKELEDQLAQMDQKE